jgi:hypothetical protein
VAVPAGDSLRVGTFQNAADNGPTISLGTAPQMRFEGTRLACQQTSGQFTITDLAVGPGYALNRARVEFEQRCDGGTAAVRGQVAVVTDPWR